MKSSYASGVALVGFALAAGVGWSVRTEAATLDVNLLAAVAPSSGGSRHGQPTDDPSQRPVAALGVSGVVESVRTSGESPDRAEAYGYAMPNAQESFAWPDGAGEGSLSSGVGMLAIPDFTKGSEPSAAGSHLAVANLVHESGFTDFAIYIHDSDRLLDFVCQKLNENQTEYIDHNSWGYIPRGFRGSAVISATFWEHDLFDATGVFVRNSVGLAAVADNWGAEPAAGVDGASAFVAAPMFAHNGLLAGPSEQHDALCAFHYRRGRPSPGGSSTPTANSPATSTTTATPPPSATVRPTTSPENSPAYSARSPQIHFPAIGPGSLGITYEILTIQNAGKTPSRAVVLLWKDGGDCGAACAGPSGFVCTGLLAPGSSWRVGAPDITNDTRSAVVYSFDPNALQTAAPPCADPANCPCEFGTLFGAVVGNCAEFEAFSRAYSGGSLYSGVSLDVITGSPLAATIERTRLNPSDPVRSMTEAYRGISGPLLGGAERSGSRHIVQLPHLVGAAGIEQPASLVHIQNAGHRCATVELWFTNRDECAAALCATVDVPAGQSALLGLETCAPAFAVGSGYVVSTAPAGVVVDTVSGGTLMSYTGSARAVQAIDGGYLFAGARDVAFAPLVYAAQGVPGWTSLLHLQNSGDLEEVFKVTLLGRGGETAVERQYGPICAGASLTVNAADLVPCECCEWIGSAHVQAFPASSAPVATPFSEAAVTAVPCDLPTRQPGTPSPTPQPGTPTPTPFGRPTATRCETLPCPGATIYLPVARRQE